MLAERKIPIRDSPSYNLAGHLIIVAYTIFVFAFSFNGIINKAYNLHNAHTKDFINLRMKFSFLFPCFTWFYGQSNELSVQIKFGDFQWAWRWVELRVCLWLDLQNTIVFNFYFICDSNNHDELILAWNVWKTKMCEGDAANLLCARLRYLS